MHHLPGAFFGSKDQRNPQIERTSSPELGSCGTLQADFREHPFHTLLGWIEGC